MPMGRVTKSEVYVKYNERSRSCISYSARVSWVGVAWWVVRVFVWSCSCCYVWLRMCCLIKWLHVTCKPFWLTSGWPIGQVCTVVPLLRYIFFPYPTRHWKRVVEWVVGVCGVMMHGSMSGRRFWSTSREKNPIREDLIYEWRWPKAEDRFIDIGQMPTEQLCVL